MRNKRDKSKLRVFITNIMSGATEEEILAAEQNFQAYLQLVKEITTRVHLEKEQTLDSS
jgi:ribosomal protein S20